MYGEEISVEQSEFYKTVDLDDIVSKYVSNPNPNPNPKPQTPTYYKKRFD